MGWCALDCFPQGNKGGAKKPAAWRTWVGPHPHSVVSSSRLSGLAPGDSPWRTTFPLLSFHVGQPRTRALLGSWGDGIRLPQRRRRQSLARSVCKGSPAQTVAASGNLLPTGFRHVISTASSATAARGLRAGTAHAISRSSSWIVPSSLMTRSSSFHPHPSVTNPRQRATSVGSPVLPLAPTTSIQG